MNTIFKIKWNVVTQCYAVCSELVKRAGKPVGSAVVLSVISVGAMATEITPNAEGRYIATTSGEITGTTTGTINDNVISISNGAAVTINGDMVVNSHLSKVDGSNIVTVEGNNSSLKASKFTINGITAVAGQRLHPYALLVRNNASANIEDLTVNLKVPHEFASGKAEVGKNVDGGFGIAVGTEHANSGTSTVTVQNANIKERRSNYRSLCRDKHRCRY
uniref:ESPR domain-containing protein n=1 Tax=Histophilus somni (strain 129Pt) TaxID=205914 RepID=Q0I4Y7_HISS1